MMEQISSEFILIHQDLAISEKKFNMKVVLLISILFVIQVPLLGQEKKIEVKTIGIKDLPVGIKYNGNIIEVLSWNDRNGQNIFISSSIGPIVKEQAYGEPTVKKQIFAEQYTIRDKKILLLWGDLFVESVCPMHVELDFIPNSISITDLDNNGITETTLVYKNVCRSDVSLADFVVQIHTSKSSFCLRGYTLIRVGKPYDTMDLTNYEFNLEKALVEKAYTDEFAKLNGRYTDTKEFINTPPEFLNHSIEIWKKYVEEKF